MGDFKYKAFISYSHKDRKWTRWLHRRLETYPIPKNIIGNVTSAGVIPKRLKPIFRDREELSASNNLGEKIEAALASSKNLIIICSPAAAKSKWVNQEILTFKQNNRDAQLFSVIVEGEPYASTMPGREDEECFPPALRFEVNADGTLSDIPAEPLAADLRPHADGKRLGFLKLISGMIGVGLDDVVQRDMKRSRKRVTAITTGSLAAVLAMGTLTGFALDARREAEQRRNDAEGLMDFMIGDLRDRLEPVGRLDVLDDVATKALKYYEDQGTSALRCAERGKWGRALHLASEVAVTTGNNVEFKDYTKRAFELTNSNLSLCKRTASTIFDHAQSAFWAGYSNLIHDDINSTGQYFELYKNLADELISIDSQNVSFQKELAAALVNLGTYYISIYKFDEAVTELEKAQSLYAVITATEPLNAKTARNYAEAIGWKAKAFSQLGRLEDSERSRRAEVSEAKRILSEVDSSDWKALYILASGQRALARLAYIREDYYEATRFAKAGIIDFQKLVEQDSLNSKWRLGLASCQTLLITSLAKNGDSLGSNVTRDHLKKTLSLLPKELQFSEKELRAQLEI